MLERLCSYKYLSENEITWYLRTDTLGENDCKSKFYENSVILIKNVYDSTSGFYEV